MRTRDSGGDMFDEDWGDSETVGLVLACAVAVSAPRFVAELRVPIFRGGRGGKSFSTVGLGVEVRDPLWGLGAVIGGTGECCLLLGSFSTIETDIEVDCAPVPCARARIRKGFFVPMGNGPPAPVACGMVDAPFG